MSDDKRPAPLVTAEVDLRDFAFMPLDVLRLRDSDLAALATGDEFKAAVLLWCTAWHQVPAGSLPNDERLLARYSGAGALWKKVRAEALRGFVECADGRLHHSTIAEKVMEAWARKMSQRDRTKKATEERERRRRDASAQRDEHRNDERHDQRDVARDDQRNVERNVVQGTGTGTGTVIPSVGVPTAAATAPPQLFSVPTPDPKPLTARERVWAIGVPLLGETARGLLGKLAKTYGEEALAAVLAEAMADPPADPKAWVTAACERRRNASPAKANGHDAKPGLLDDPTPQWALDAGFPDRFHAENEGCHRRNAAEFRGGKRIEAATP